MTAVIHDEAYKGHQVHVETFAVGAKFGWRYTVDGLAGDEERLYPMAVERLMLEEGLVGARFEIDRREPRR